MIAVVALESPTVLASETTTSVSGVVPLLVAIVVTAFAAMGEVGDSRTETARGTIAAVRDDFEPDSGSAVLPGLFGTFCCVAPCECRFAFISSFLCASLNCCFNVRICVLSAKASASAAAVLNGEGCGCEAGLAGDCGGCGFCDCCLD